MQETIVEAASDPLQYDREELIWTNEGDKDNFNRRLYHEALRPLLASLHGKKVLDIGSGRGWLSDEMAQAGADVLGIEPSIKNVDAARVAFPDVQFARSSLQDFETKERFDFITAVMVLEHFRHIDEDFARIAALTQPGGTFVAIVGDFEKFTQGRNHHPLQKQTLDADEVATRVDYGERAGVMCDIIRTVDRYNLAAERAGLTVREHQPLLPKPWHPRYQMFKGKPLFHLLVFSK